MADTDTIPLIHDMDSSLDTYDIDNYDNDSSDSDSFDLHYSSSSFNILKKKFKYKVYIFILLFICILSIGLLAGILSFSLCFNSSTNIPRDDIILNTQEYQIDFDSIEIWADRDLQIHEWMIFYEEQSRYLNLSQATTTSHYRVQYNAHLSSNEYCQGDFNIRERNYLDILGNYEYSTVDIKGNSEYKETAENLPYWPSYDYINTSLQKCEQDIHECSSKYSRETQVQFNEAKDIFTCGSLANYFPYAFPDLLASNINKPVDIYLISNWFVQEYSGYLNDYTKYIASFTLRYDDIQTAMSSSPIPISGEFSMRIFSLNDGKTEQWDNDVINDTVQTWHKLIAYFGNIDC